jgi:hypothetical protein
MLGLPGDGCDVIVFNKRFLFPLHTATGLDKTIKKVDKITVSFGWLGSDFIYVSLETRWLGQKPWFLIAGTTL